MILFLLIGVFIGLLSFSSENVLAQTYVSGAQYDGAGGPWNITGSPYIIVGDVTVPLGENLTIDPGVQVRFDGHYRITVDGRLHAVGTAVSRISMTSNNTTPAPGDWDQIRVSSSGHAEVSYSDISYGDYGLFLFSSSNHNITFNNISSNNYYGISLSQSDNNNINGNDFSQNGNIGMYFWLSDNNNITGNNFTSNARGLDLDLSSNNRIYHNNIINNVNQAWDNTPDNLWNFTYSQYPLRGGNYWSDWSPNCTDDMNGPNQNISGADGICDINYTIDSNSIDHYPLKNPWTPPETTPPDAITLSAGAITTTSVQLTWTAVADNDSDPASGPASKYDIRYSTGPITDPGTWGTATHATGEPLPQVYGSAESFTVTGLLPDTTFYFAAKVGDEVPNWSPLSNSLVATTLTPDTTPPDAITLATGTITTTSVQLTWTAVADDGSDPSSGPASEYDIRYSMGAGPIIDPGTWKTAIQVNGEPLPKAFGLEESFTIEDLQPGTTYCFAIKVRDEIPQWSLLSNSLVATTLTPDTTPPDAITLAAGTITTISIQLTWTAVADDGSIFASGPASEYDIRYSTGAGCPLTDPAKWAIAAQATGEPAPQAFGLSESFTITGLSPGTTYCFAAMVGDEVPNWSPLSNNILATTLSPDSTPSDAITLAAGTINTTSIQLIWTAVADNGSIPASGPASEYDIRYSTGAGCPLTDLAKWAIAVQVTGEPAPQVFGSSESFTVTGLSPGTTYCFAAMVGDEVPNWSQLSNSLEATTQAPPDKEKPVISDVEDEPQSQTQGGSVNLTAVVTDDRGIVDYVKVRIIAPDGTEKGNFTMEKANGDKYYYVFDIETGADTGSYKYVVWATDQNANVEKSAEKSFTVTTPVTEPPAPDLPSNFWWLLILNDIVIIAAVLIVVWLLLKRKKKSEKAPTEMPKEEEPVAPSLKGEE
jgi:parallel beta-helix repeat protein